MKARTLRIVLAALAVIVMLCVTLLLAESRARIVRRWIDDAIYDNRWHYLPCERLPPLSEVERVVREHQDVIGQIEAVHPGFVGVEVNPCGDGQNADITFWYATHGDRVAIEQIIGSDTFFGVPYNLNNR